MRCVLHEKSATGVQCITADVDFAETDWFKRTDLFQIVHTVALTRAIVESHPAHSRALHDAFGATKSLAAARLRYVWLAPAKHMMPPRVRASIERTVDTMSEYCRSYGCSKSRDDVE